MLRSLPSPASAAAPAQHGQGIEDGAVADQVEHRVQALGFGPLAPPHVHFGVVDSERLDLDDDVTGLEFRVRDLLVNEAVEPAELL